jgi:hypothetical protein
VRVGIIIIIVVVAAVAIDPSRQQPCRDHIVSLD